MPATLSAYMQAAEVVARYDATPSIPLEIKTWPRPEGWLIQGWAPVKVTFRSGQQMHTIVAVSVPFEEVSLSRDGEAEVREALKRGLHQMRGYARAWRRAADAGVLLLGPGRRRKSRAVAAYEFISPNSRPDCPLWQGPRERVHA